MAQFAIQFLAWPKKFGQEQKILGPVKDKALKLCFVLLMWIKKQERLI